MNKTVYCRIKMGELNQTLFIKNDPFSAPREEKISLQDLPTFLTNDKQISKVYISGCPKNFLQKIEKDVKQKEQILYANTDKKPIVFIYSQF